MMVSPMISARRFQSFMSQHCAHSKVNSRSWVISVVVAVAIVRIHSFLLGQGGKSGVRTCGGQCFLFHVELAVHHDCV